MIFLSLLIALVAERIAPQFQQYRQFSWLRGYGQWLLDAFSIDRIPPWGCLFILIAPPLLAVWLLQGLFENALFGLFELAFNVVLVFYCLGPAELDQQVDAYLETVETGDTEQRQRSAARLFDHPPSNELAQQARQVSERIFVLANTRIYAVIFWVLVLGPLGAAGYRLLERLTAGELVDSTLRTRLKPLLHRIMAYLDWLPVRLTAFAYMLSGNFEEGLHRFRNYNSVASDLYEQNAEILEQVGSHSISSHEVQNEEQAISLVKKTRGLYLRTLVVWMLLVLIVTVLF